MLIRRTLNKVDKVAGFLEEWTLFIAVMGGLLTLFASVVTRFGSRWGLMPTLTWPEELVREVIIYTTFVGCAAAVRNRSLIRVDALPNLVKGLKKPLDNLSHFALLCFAVFIIWYGAKMALFQYKMGMKTIILKVPQVALYSILPLMGILMIVRLLIVFYEDFFEVPVDEPEQSPGGGPGQALEAPEGEG